MLENLSHYKILDRIGAGGIGEVYRARDTRHGRTVAVKVVDDGLKDTARLLDEAEALTRLSHPNVATLFEVDRGQGYLVYEFVPGSTLATTISGRPLNPRRAVDFATQIADALAEAHAGSFVHGNLRPEAVIITPKGNAKILDFGLAAWSRIAGQGPYVSPEQSRGADTDYRTDIFAAGVILYEMLTGRAPGGARGSAPASSINRAVPAELDPIVARATAANRDERYESAATLAAELRSVAAILDVRAGTLEPASRQVVADTRPRAGVWLLALLVLAAVATLVWLAVRAG
jgi:serine/threonine-protein kinase